MLLSMDKGKIIELLEHLAKCCGGQCKRSREAKEAIAYLKEEG